MGAIEEYKKCTALREAALDDSDRYVSMCESYPLTPPRLLAQAHYSLAVAYIYNAGDENADTLANKKAALQSYQAAQRVSVCPPHGVLPV